MHLVLPRADPEDTANPAFDRQLIFSFSITLPFLSQRISTPSAGTDIPAWPGQSQQPRYCTWAGLVVVCFGKGTSNKRAGAAGELLLLTACFHRKTMAAFPYGTRGCLAVLFNLHFIPQNRGRSSFVSYNDVDQHISFGFAESAGQTGFYCVELLEYRRAVGRGDS